jgi:hypothetical protein
MCDIFGSNNGGQQAAQQQLAMIQAQQAKHDRAVKQDTAAIDAAFKPFNDDYYNSYTKAYEDALNPQLDFQYNRAGGTLASQLADADQTDSSTGLQRQADLNQTYNSARAGIGNSAVDATNALRANVSNAKTGLYGLAQQATDPLSLATQAQAQAGSIVAPSSYPTLGSVFSSVLQPVAAGVKTAAGGVSTNPNFNGLAPLSNSGGSYG